MKKYLKNIILILILICFNQSSYAKPVPPGSGEGDVPANILILLDSSASMSRRISGTRVNDITGISMDSTGRYYATQSRGKRGILRFTTAGEIDTTYNGNRGVWAGAANDTCSMYYDSADGQFKSELTPINTLISSPYQAQHAQFATDGAGTTMSDVMFVIGNGKIVGVDNDGSCKYYIKHNLRIARGIDVTDHNNKSYLMVHGWTTAGRCNIQIFNLTDKNLVASEIGGTSARSITCNSWRSALNGDMTRFYTTHRGHIYWLNLEAAGTNNYQVTAADANEMNRPLGHCWRKNRANQLWYVDGLAVSPNKSGDDDDIVVTVSKRGDRLQKFEIDLDVGEGNNDDGTVACTFITEAGRWSNNSNKGSSAGSVAAANITTKNPRGVFVTSNRILTGDTNGQINVIDDDQMDGTNDDTAWLMEMGSDPKNRWQGAKMAIKAIMNDPSLTTGAHFGFGHWNAGHGAENGFYKNTWPWGGKYCHRNDGCKYYGEWELGPGEKHPEGKSSICHSDGCVLVGIGPNGHEDILNVIDTVRLKWGTDGNAAGQMAEGYFTDEKVNIIDTKSKCQLNYVIIIGDGNWTNHGTFTTHIENLRKKEVTTLVVAYGDGINTNGMRNFDRMAVTGSCAQEGDSDCEPTIVAETPAELKTELEAKIRQIIAEKLAFTAPSITATVQEGGALYQAQFTYDQWGEWNGTILRKSVDGLGDVCHGIPGDPDHPCTDACDCSANWNAKDLLKVKAGDAAGAKRKIWTVTGGTEYIGVEGGGAWNNWTTDNSLEIQDELERLGYEIGDYHTAATACGEQDEVNGLINFMRGDDFFNYRGDCSRINETRDWVMADVYHSQLIEVGPPDASLYYTNTNQEAYWRTVNNYSGFKTLHSDRKRVLYAGANNGMLHAFDAVTGDEEWAFIPPFMSGLLPTVINTNLMGKVSNSSPSKGGSNAIFGVDGSPIVHDVYMKGLKTDGTWDDKPGWHSILIIPFGRGGAGFSVLDVTEPIIENDLGPMHMFSIFNDKMNNRVMVADNVGLVTEYNYSAASAGVGDSLEALKAKSNYRDAEETDGGSESDVMDARNAIAACHGNSDATGGIFRTGGTNSCYEDKKFTFDMEAPTLANGTDIAKDSIVVSALIDGDVERIDYKKATMVNGRLVLEFDSAKTFNFSGSATNEKVSDNFSVKLSCTAESGIKPQWDYSQLGETWSTPRIARLPSANAGNRGDIYKDKYVAIMGGGMGSANSCEGSGLFLVDLEAKGEIFGAIVPTDGSLAEGVAAKKLNGGPIRIVDTDPDGVVLGDGARVTTIYGSDIGNSVPNNPIVITPDTAQGVPWRGAMVYINDLEGKITKINLTNSIANGADYFSQTTLARVNGSRNNQRYSYFSMEAGIGASTNELWLFGGTGDFSNLGGHEDGMDNILYGIKDPDFPFFRHLNDLKIPRPYGADGKTKNSDFLKYAHMGADQATSIDNATDCVPKSGPNASANCPSSAQKGWKVSLDVDGDRKSRKLSGSPTLFKGVVYYPVYQPPLKGGDKCNIGEAYICAADDECGDNVSDFIQEASGTFTDTLSGTGDASVTITNNFSCKGVRPGILSEIVVFGDQLFANVAGPSEDKDTLYQTDAVKGEVSSSRGNWRDSSN